MVRLNQAQADWITALIEASDTPPPDGDRELVRRGFRSLCDLRDDWEAHLGGEFDSPNEAETQIQADSREIGRLVRAVESALDCLKRAKVHRGCDLDHLDDLITEAREALEGVES